MLDKQVVQMAIKELCFEPECDLFATRINKQFDKYISWKPDPESFAIDAFSVSWGKMKCYCFPPFSVLPAVLQKMTVEKVTGLVVLPNWPIQHYYSTTMKMLIAQPLYVHKRKTLLQIPNSKQIHKIWDKLDLLICLLSGEQSKIENFRKMLPKYSYHGDHQLLNNMKVICGDGKFSVVDGKLIRFVQLLQTFWCFVS